MAGILTGHPDGSTTGGAIWRTTSVLIGMRRSLARNSPGGWGTVLALRFAGLLVAVGTLLLGLVRLGPDRSVDLLAALILGWLVGWVMGPIMVRGAGQGVRPEWFALLPFPPRRLAAGLLGASFVGVAPALTLVAFAALPAAASRLGLLPVAPATVALTVAVTAFAGQGWAWPWIFATLPAVLGGTAGLTVWISAARPTREKDPQRRTSPYDTSDDPSAAGALIGGQYLMLLLAALTAVPAGALVLAGAARHQPVLQAAGVLAGIATGVLLYWWGGRAATRRLAGRGAELMDLLNLGPQAQSPRSRRAGSLRDWLRPAREPGAPLRRGKAALRGVLLTVGILCIVPQGLVPIGFNLLGVDQQVKVWFVARYLEQDLQAPAAAAFIAVGLLAILFAGAISRSR